MNSGESQDRIEIKFKDNSVSWERLTELLHAAYKTNADNGMNFAAASQTVEQTIKRVGDGRILLAFDGLKLVGTITCKIKKDGNSWYKKGINGYIYQFAVLPEYRKNGIGDMLLQGAYEYFEKNNAKGIILDTAEKAERLINYYKRQGFIPVDYTHWSGTNYNSVILRKSLGIEHDDKYCEKMFGKAKRRLVIKQSLRGLKIKLKGLFRKK